MLQNFPKSFILVGSDHSKLKQLGNTIPTNLCFFIIQNLVNLIKNVKKK